MLSDKGFHILAQKEQYQLLKVTFTDYVRQCEDVFAGQETRIAEI